MATNYDETKHPNLESIEDPSTRNDLSTDPTSNDYDPATNS